MVTPITCTIARKPKFKLLYFTIIALSFIFFAGQSYSQTSYKIVSSSHIKVSGTSNLHDWTMVAENFNCEGNFVLKGGALQDVSSLSFVLPVTNLKSKESLMNTRTYKALKSETYPKITFKLTSATVLPQSKTIKATGNLTIAGVTNVVSLLSNYTVNADESITCKGSEVINMTNYKIKAPSFMLGALKVGEKVTIDILLKLKK
jgi:polyisoprenoid-binding protein YceI